MVVSGMDDKFLFGRWNGLKLYEGEREQIVFSGEDGGEMIFQSLAEYYLILFWRNVFTIP